MLTSNGCLLYTSDAADDMQCVDLGGRRIIKKNNCDLTKRIIDEEIIKPNREKIITDFDENLSFA